MQELVIEEQIAKFAAGLDVEPSNATLLFEALIGTPDKELLAELLRSWNAKGFTEAELVGFARVMRQRMIRVASSTRPLVDIVGTGAASAKTFNVSTASALAAAGAGLTVAKHGNRAATSRAGSADVLTELGVDLQGSPASLGERLDRDGICFLFAPNHHALSATLASARRELGEPTIFNCLGPLCNPAMPSHSVIGVSRREWLLPMANALFALGTTRSWVVHGECGLDEIAPFGRTLIAEVDLSGVREFSLSAEDFGVSFATSELPPPSNPSESAKTIRAILNGELTHTDSENLVVLNAAAAIFIAGKAASLPEACAEARASIRSGSALAKLNSLREEL